MGKRDSASSKAPAARKGRAQKAGTKNTAESSAAGSLDAGAAKRRRQLDRRNTEERADRALVSHFKTVSVQRLSTTTVKGLTARDKVVEAIRGSPRNARLGATCWRELSDQYGFQEGDLQLEPRNKADIVGQDLAISLSLCFESNPNLRSVASLSSVLAARSQINQREFIGVLNALPNMQAAGVAKASVDQLWVDMSKTLAR